MKWPHLLLASILVGHALATQAATPSVSTGAIQGVALSSSGVVYAWGDYKMTSKGIRQDANTTLPTTLLTDGVEISAGHYHTLARKADGSVWAWGSNSNKQLGPGAVYATRSAAPLQVTGLSDVRSLIGGGFHSLAVQGNGTVMAWGSNDYGQLGIGDQAVKNLATPTAVKGLSNAVAVAAGWGHSLTLDGNGQVWAWGGNGHRQLGITSADSTLYQAQAVSGLPKIRAIAAGGYHSLALSVDGTVWAWGQNLYGQLGVPGATDALPTQIPGLVGVRAIAAGYHHSLALLEDGTVMAWGDAQGVGKSTDVVRPERLTLPRTIASLSGGTEHSLVLDSEGLAWSWGSNAQGQLGNGTFARSRSPVMVLNESGNSVLDLQPTANKTYPSQGMPAMAVALSLGVDNLRVTMTDAAAAGFSGEIYVTGLVKSTSPLLTKAGIASSDPLVPVCFTATGLVRCGPGDTGKALFSGNLQQGQTINVVSTADFERFRKEDGLGTLAAWFVPSQASNAFSGTLGCGIKQGCATDLADGNNFADGTATPPPNQEISADTQGSPLNRRTLVAKISARAAAKAGASALICSWAVWPGATPTTFMQTGENSWALYDAESMPLLRAVGGASAISWPVVKDTDLSGIAGTLAYIAFGKEGERCSEVMRDPARSAQYNTVN